MPDFCASDATLDSDVSIAAIRLSNPRLSSKRHCCIPTLKPILKRHTYSTGLLAHNPRSVVVVHLSKSSHKPGSDFLLHVLPSGFQKVRAYGWLASRNKQPALAAIRKTLDAQPPPPPPEDGSEHLDARILRRLSGWTKRNRQSVRLSVRLSVRITLHVSRFMFYASRFTHPRHLLPRLRQGASGLLRRNPPRPRWPRMNILGTSAHAPVQRVRPGRGSGAMPRHRQTGVERPLSTPSSARKCTRHALPPRQNRLSQNRNNLPGAFQTPQRCRWPGAAPFNGILSPMRQKTACHQSAAALHLPYEG